MSFITSVGERILFPPLKKITTLCKVTKTVPKQTVSDTIPCAIDVLKMPYADTYQELISMAYYNTYRMYACILENFSPEHAKKVKTFLKNFGEYGFSSGDIKYFLNNEEGILDKFKLLRDSQFMKALFQRKSLLANDSIFKISQENKNAVIKLLKDKNITDEQLSNAAHLITDKNIPILKDVLKDKNINTEILKNLTAEKLNKYNGKALKYILKIKNIDKNEMLRIMENTDKSNYDIAIKLLQKSKGNVKGIDNILYFVSSASSESILENRICNYLYKLAGKKDQASYFEIFVECEKAKKLRHKLLNELLDNTNMPFKFKEIEHYTTIIKSLTKYNYEEIKTALLNKNTNLKELAKSLYRDFKLKPVSKGKPGYSTANYTLSQDITEKQLRYIKKGFEVVKRKYGIIPQGDFYLSKCGSNDLFLTIESFDGLGLGLTYKFDKTTGKIISVSKDGKTINIPRRTEINDLVQTEKKLNCLHRTPYRINTTIKGKKGKYETLYTESSVKGQYDIYHKTPDGKVAKIGYALYTPNGAVHVKRTLTSSNGIKTRFSYREDRIGNSYYSSVIIDKQGQTLSEIKRTFKVLDDNHFISTKNGQAYDIVFTEKEVVVTKLNSEGVKTAETVKFKIKNDVPDDILEKVFQESAQLAGITKEIAEKMSEPELKKLLLSKMSEAYKKYGIEQNTIDKKCVNMLKRLPGDEWFAMDKCCKYVMPQNAEKYNAYSSGESIFMSDELKNNLGVFSHELGHSKFDKLNLVNDKKLLEIYNAEKKSYTSKYPESRIQSIDYFLSGNEKELGGLNETCAEANLISNTIQSWDVIQDRTIFLEQYFPKTISYIRQKFNSLA